MIKASDVERFEEQHKIELPRDIGSEIATIGSILNNPEYILKSEFLKPRMFSDRCLGCIYHIVNSLYNKGIIEIDNFLVSNEITTNKNYKSIFDKYDNIGDLMSYLDDLRLLSRGSLKEYELLVEKVITISFKRESYIKLTEMSSTLLSSKEGINELNYKIQKDIVKFSETYIVNNDIKSMGDKIDDIWGEILNERSAGFAGLPSKFVGLNEYFTYERGELVVIGGRAKSGKSMFFLNEAIHKVENGVPTAIFDTEMNDKAWTIRFLAHKSGVDIKKIKSGKDMTLVETRKVEEAKEWLKQKPLIHIYDPRWTMDKVYMTAKQLKISMNLDFLIYDYIKVASTSEHNPTHMQLGEWANFLKNDIAGELNIGVLAGGQMSPKEQRLADSDLINRYASTIAYWIHKTREEKVTDGSKQGNCKLYIDYHRNGGQFEEGEYLNFVFTGDKANIEQAEVFYHASCEDPY